MNLAIWLAVGAALLVVGYLSPFVFTVGAALGGGIWLVAHRLTLWDRWNHPAEFPWQREYRLWRELLARNESSKREESHDPDR